MKREKETSQLEPSITLALSVPLNNRFLIVRRTNISRVMQSARIEEQAKDLAEKLVSLDP